MSLLPTAVQIPYSTYQNLLDHLLVQAPTDAWAQALLQELQAAAKPVVAPKAGSR
jgi:hypothetical protein